MEWISAYMFYEEPLDNFLVQAVKPIVEELKKRNLIKQYFFIRYWEKGTHIRLRVYLKHKKEKQKTQAIIVRCFYNYVNHYPSTRNAPLFITSLEAEAKWYPNNFITFIKYEPELERYGGIYTIEFAERYFEASSEIVFKILTQYKEPDKLKIAIQLHLIFLHSFGMTLIDINSLFKNIFYSWLPLSYTTDNFEIGRDQKEKNTIQAFEKLYNSQKNALISFHEMILKQLKKNTKFEDSWLNTWSKQNKKLYSKLNVIASNGNYFVPEWLKLDLTSSVPQQKQKLFYLYKSLIHMTNNRLGISYREESYLGYLIYKSTESIMESKIEINNE